MRKGFSNLALEVQQNTQIPLCLGICWINSDRRLQLRYCEIGTFLTEIGMRFLDVISQSRSLIGCGLTPTEPRRQQQDDQRKIPGHGNHLVEIIRLESSGFPA